MDKTKPEAMQDKESVKVQLSFILNELVLDCFAA